MPITFSVTCDTDEELARFLENFRLAKEISVAKQAEVEKAAPQASEEELAAPAKVAKAPGRPAKKAPVKKVKAPIVKIKQGKAATAKAGRKPGQLTPIIESAITEMIKKRKPFRSKDVTNLIMEKNPKLNANSVTTGVSKHLNETRLSHTQIKDTVGRPYKLYKP